MEADNTPFSQRSFGRKILAVVIAVPFLGGAALIMGARFAFFIPRDERNNAFLVGLAMFVGSIVLAFIANKYRRYRARSHS
jgi:hypothetical protein